MTLCILIQAKVIPLNLRFDLDKIATEMIFAVTISENPPQQHIKKVGKSR